METESNRDRLMTVKELSAYVGLAVGTLYNKVHAGEIPFIRIGRAVRFRKSDIDAWIASHERESGKPVGADAGPADNAA